jgi:rubrerythrin
MRLRHRVKDVWEPDVLARLDQKRQDEAAILEQYGRLAEEVKEEWVRYLLRMVVADEERHHRLLDEMRNHLAWETGSDDQPMVPWLTEPADRRRLVELAERFLAVERDDLHELRRLRAELEPIAETSLLGLLTELMELDTRKHIKVLEFLIRAAR